MKYPETYGLTKDVIARLDTHDRDIVSSLVEEIEISIILDQCVITLPDSSWEQAEEINLGYDVVESVAQATIQKGKERGRGIVDYERAIGLDVIHHLITTNSKNYLDAGCGLGKAVREIDAVNRALDLNLSIDACDILEPVGLNDRINGFQANIMDGLYSGKMYDLITSAYVVPYFTDPILGILNLYNVLNPVGTLAFTFVPDSLIIDNMSLSNPDNSLYSDIKRNGGSISTFEISQNPYGAVGVHMTKGDDVDNKFYLLESKRAEIGFPVYTKYVRAEP